MNAFQIMLYVGIVLSVLGLGGLVWCIVKVARAKRAGLDNDALNEVIRKALPINMIALFLSMIGLAMVALGVFLG